MSDSTENLDKAQKNQKRVVAAGSDPETTGPADNLLEEGSTSRSIIFCSIYFFEDLKSLESSMSCKGICIHHKSFSLPSRFRYINGQKRCQICQVFIKWQGFWCPCCGFRLRGKPRNTKDKNRYKMMSNL